VLVHRVTKEYGVPLFGQDYGQDLMTFVRAEYEPVATFGAEPLRERVQPFGIQVCRRRPTAPPPSAPGG
jgi:hypothetical protein